MKKKTIIWVIVVIVVIALLIWGYKTNWWGLKKSAAPANTTASQAIATARKFGVPITLATLSQSGYTNIESSSCIGLGGTIVTIDGVKYCSQPNLDCPKNCLTINDPK